MSTVTAKNMCINIIREPKQQPKIYICDKIMYVIGLFLQDNKIIVIVFTR